MMLVVAPLSASAQNQFPVRATLNRVVLSLARHWLFF